MRLLMGLLIVLATGQMAQAHPHVFVDADVELLAGADGGMIVRLVWTYDEFFSLLLTGDLDLDQDGDGALTDAELQSLSEMVMDWPPGYEGDLYVTADGQPVSLPPKQGHSVAFQDGQMIETVERPLPAGISGSLTIRVYDPSYYTAYSLNSLTIAPETGCVAQIERADPDAAAQELAALVANVPAGITETAYPEVGASFADTIVMSCDD